VFGYAMTNELEKPNTRKYFATYFSYFS
jgi:hypothetical protein